MLAYYTALVKKEDLVKKLSDDANNLASLANDLVCELKVFNSACNDRDVETSLDSISKALDLSKIVSAMITNIESNYKSYVSSLLPQAEQTEQKQEEKKVEEKESSSGSDPSQLVTLLEAVRSLKEIKDSLDK